MKTLPLSKDKFALLDDLDFDYFNQWKWSYSPNGYAVRNTKIGSGWKTIYLHQEILGKRPGFETDHINRNKLDNCRTNLRFVTHRENNLNKNLLLNNTSGFTGVSWNKRLQKWQAYIEKFGKRIHLGHFADKTEAITVRRSYQ